MIIGCVGFSWSGSSAVTDLLSEYDDNQVLFDEFIYAYHPDSLSDLDFHLNEGHSKVLSSSVAIPRFKRISIKLLKKQTKGKIRYLVDDYLNKLIQCSWIGDCQGQLAIRNMFLYDYFGQRIMSRRIMPKLPYSLTRKMRFYPLKRLNFSILPDSFLDLTQEFTGNILQSMGFDIQKNIVLDQPFPGNSPSRCMRYFKNSKAIIVDRDPRDMYLLLKSVFKKVAYSVPIDRVENFIEYYKNIHKTLENEKKNPNVLYIYFESLVYDYEKTKRIIEDFLGLQPSSCNGTIFVPGESSNNTQLFKKIKGFDGDIIKIQKCLSSYLFDFEKYSNSIVISDKCHFFDDNPNKRKIKK